MSGVAVGEWGGRSVVPMNRVRRTCETGRGVRTEVSTPSLSSTQNSTPTNSLSSWGPCRGPGQSCLPLHTSTHVVTWTRTSADLTRTSGHVVPQRHLLPEYGQRDPKVRLRTREVFIHRPTVYLRRVKSHHGSTLRIGVMDLLETGILTTIGLKFPLL